jgi:hypothetical protein
LHASRRLAILANEDSTNSETAHQHLTGTNPNKEGPPDRAALPLSDRGPLPDRKASHHAARTSIVARVQFTDAGDRGN